MDMTRRVGAEFFGTFWLTFGGCGSAVLAAAFPPWDRVSWCRARLRLDRADHGLRGRPHLGRPLQSSRHHRIVGRQAVVAPAMSFPISSHRWSGRSSPQRCCTGSRPGSQAGCPAGSPRTGTGSEPGQVQPDVVPGDGMVMTFFFLVIIIGCTSKGAAVGFAGIPIGLGLTLIHLVSIPVTNTSVNPARSTGPALFAGGEYVSSSGCSGWHRSSAR